MTHKFSGSFLLSALVWFIAILLDLIAMATPAQTTGAGPLIFVSAVTFDSGGNQASSVAVADLNGDGKADLVVTNCGSCYGPPGIGQGSSVAVFLGNGDGTFRPPVSYDSGGDVPVFIAVADVNSDGKPDLVVVNRNSNDIGVLLGKGDGTFQAAVTYGSGGSALSVTVADVNGDGRLDLIVAIECADQNCDGWVGVLLGNGDGTFQPAVTYASGGKYATAIATADVNGDGKPDLVVTVGCVDDNCDGWVGVLLGNGNGTFQPAVTFRSAGDAIPPLSLILAVVDLNGDGKPDIVAESSACCGSSNGVVGVLLGNGDGTFQPVVTYESGAGGWGTSVAVADVNGDGKLDIVATDDSSDGAPYSGLVAVLLGNGDGTFQSAQNYSSGGFLTNSVAVADVNGDGKPDLVVANLCSDNGPDCKQSSVGVLLNNNGAPPTTTSLISSVNPAAVGWGVTYTATVALQSGGTAKGTVNFYDGYGTLAAVALVNNQAAYSTSYAKKGTHSITAVYSGELNRAAGSISNAVEEVITMQRPTKTVVTTSGSPSMVGQPVTFTATVTSTYGPIPDGDLVTFYDRATEIGTGSTANGVVTFTTSSLTAKKHVIKATYAGDAKFKPSTGKVTQVVEK